MLLMKGKRTVLYKVLSKVSNWSSEDENNEKSSLHRGTLPEVGRDRQWCAALRAVPLPRTRVVVQQKFDHGESAPCSRGVEWCLAL